MERRLLIFAALISILLAGGSTAAQEPAAAAPAASSSEDVKTSSSEDVPSLRLSLSPERLKELVAQPAAPIQESLEARPTFRIQIEERLRLQQLFRTPETSPVDKRPPPPGGLYGYEQQRMVLNAIGSGGTRMEPYAAFNGGELITLALEGLLTKYLGGRSLNTASTLERTRAEAAAREEVAREVRAYCAAQPDAGAGIRICTDPIVP